MTEIFRTLAVHQAKVHRKFLDLWANEVPSDKREAVSQNLIHDGLWLTKFPLLYVPTYGVEILDIWNKSRSLGEVSWGAETFDLIRAVDADVLRFVLAVSPSEWGVAREVFWSGRPMNKPLWMYVSSWFETDARLRALWGPSDTVLDTVFP